jgi:Anti-sigma-K factor rskA, C-terminal
MSNFDDLVDTGGLAPDEEARLRRVHDLLVQAGPPAELPPSLAHPPAEKPAGADVIQFPRTAGRRMRAYGLLAAAVAACVFGGGFLLGHTKAKQASFSAIRVVPMHGVGGASASQASIQIASPDAGGNWPMLMSVRGLPKQANPGAYYELWLTRNGKAVAPCGGFRVHGATTTVRLTVPYTLKRFDGWVVTASIPGDHDPGTVVMTTQA